MFKDTTVTIDKHTFEEFVQLDDEHNLEYAEAITTEIQQALEELNSYSETEEAADNVEETYLLRGLARRKQVPRPRLATSSLARAQARTRSVPTSRQYPPTICLNHVA